MFGNSREIISNQSGIHKDLFTLLDKYQKHPFQRRVSQQVTDNFLKLDEKVKSSGSPVILDSGCGVGESTVYFSDIYKDCLIVGIDKSEHRLTRNSLFNKTEDNVIFHQANLIDFWILVNQNHWPVKKHYILYPNPWPLKKDVKKRFHAHPIFLELIKICNVIELRSNWKIYLDEFSAAFEYIMGSKTNVKVYKPDVAITPFERKFLSSGHQLFKLLIQ